MKRNAHIRTRRPVLGPLPPEKPYYTRLRYGVMGISAFCLCIVLYSYWRGAPEDVKDLFEGRASFEETMMEELGVKVIPDDDTETERPRMKKLYEVEFETDEEEEEDKKDEKK